MNKPNAVILLIIFTLFSSYKANCQYAILDSIIQTTKINSLFKKNVDWNTIKPTLLNSIDTTSMDSISAIIPAIQKLYTLLGDNHGFVSYKGSIYRGSFSKETTSGNIKYLQENYTDENVAFRTTIFQNNVGYISIPALQVDATDPNIFKDTALLFKNISAKASMIQDSLATLMSHNLNGIIVDLRLIPGGTMHIMIEGLAPLIGEGIIMYTVNSKDKYTFYSIKKGNFYEDSIRMAYSSTNFRKHKNLKIAILTSILTGSAGEQVAISFKGKKNVRFFGEKTAGFTSMNAVKNDWVNGFIFTYVDAETLDRNRHQYRNGLIPDQIIVGKDNFEDLKKDGKVAAALDWISK